MSDKNIPIFAVILPVVQEFDCKRIAEYRTGLLKSDAVLFSICGCFIIIPFKFIIYHDIRDTRILSRNLDWAERRRLMEHRATRTPAPKMSGAAR